MRINNDLLALNSHRQLGVNNKVNQKSMERLSSGLRINRAGDDAAGLAISEKMRGQIHGLKQAKRNAQDGISLIQTAEGALNETHSILQRMRQLVVQAANDTNDSSDRGQIQKEINQLTSEINRIGNSTEFNTQKILKGAEKLEGLGSSILSAEVFETTNGYTAPATSAKVTVETNGTSSISRFLEVRFKDVDKRVFAVFISIDDKKEPGISDPWPYVGGYGVGGGGIRVAAPAPLSAQDVATSLKEGLIALGNVVGFSEDYLVTTNGKYLTIESKATGANQSISVSNGDAGLITKNVSGRGKDEAYHSASAEIAFGDLSATDVLGRGITINNQSIMFTDGSDGPTDFTVNVAGVTDNVSLVQALADQLGDELDGVTLSASDNKLIVTVTAQAEAGNGIEITDGAEIGSGANPGKFSATLHVGANSGQQMTIELSDMRAANLGLTGAGEGYTVEQAVTNGTTSESALDVTSNESASNAITVIDQAIKAVSEERSKLGAYQNRLEHTISNLGTSAENLQAAESRIRDVDMSEEMMNFTKSNILNQAATAMLAQANMAPQSVLQLLG